MKFPFTFFPISEIVSPKDFNIASAKRGDMLQFQRMCGGEEVIFEAYLNSSEIVNTVINNLVM